MTPLPSDPHFRRACRVLRMIVERDEEEGLSLTLRLRSDLDRAEIELRFSGVVQLRFQGESTELNSVVIFCCEEIQSRGWEGLRFQVWDYEEEFVSFYCREIKECAPSLQEPA